MAKVVVEAAAASTYAAGATDGGKEGPPAEVSASKSLRRELRFARRQRRDLGARLRAARRGLREAEQRREAGVERLREGEVTVAAALQSLERRGAAGATAVETDEWRETTRERAEKAKVLALELENERNRHQAELEKLRQDHDGAGLDAAAEPLRRRASEAEAARRAVDERCMTLQAMLDFLRGRLDLSREELASLVLPEEAAASKEKDRGRSGGAAAAAERGPLRDVGEALARAEARALEDLEERYRKDKQELLHASNAALARRSAALRALCEGALLQRGLEDPARRCSPCEHGTLRMLLEEAKAVCDMQLASPGCE